MTDDFLQDDPDAYAKRMGYANRFDYVDGIKRPPLFWRVFGPALMILIFCVSPFYLGYQHASWHAIVALAILYSIYNVLIAGWRHLQHGAVVSLAVGMIIVAVVATPFFLLGQWMGG
jgi:hypothetical protein